MKKNFICLAALPSLLLTATALQAATPTPELKVTGKISSATCTVSAPDNGVYDLGKILPSSVKQSGITALPRLTKSWVIACDSETYLDISTADNRPDSMVMTNSTYAETNHYGMGFVNGTGKIGGYRVILLETSTVDGAQVKLCKGKLSTSLCAQETSFAYMSKNSHMSWATANNVLKAGKVFNAVIAVDADLASQNTMNGPITENTKIDGSMTLNFAYSI